MGRLDPDFQRAIHHDLRQLKALLRDTSSPIGATYRALLDQGMPAVHVVYNEDTGQVLMADGDGEYRPAHGAIREMVTGEPWRDPGTLDPVPTYAVRQCPSRLAEHNAEVADMLLYLVRIYRPDLAADPEIEDFIAEYVVAISTPDNRGRLMGLSDTYERWDVLAGNLFECATGKTASSTAASR